MLLLLRSVDGVPSRIPMLALFGLAAATRRKAAAQTLARVVRRLRLRRCAKGWRSWQLATRDARMAEVGGAVQQSSVQVSLRV